MYIVVGLILGDNLGLNSILGFIKSFRAKRFCRACRRNNIEMKRDICEHPNLLRNRASYENDIKAQDVLETGIKSDCLFNELKTFHVTENFYFDLMHDVLEGVCVYSVCQTLTALIKGKILSLDIINYRKKCFSFGELDIKNASRPLVLSKLQKNELRMTASEKLCLARYLPFMIASYVPKNNKNWILFTEMLEIIDMLFQNEFNDADLQVLDRKIQAHHKLYVSLYGPTLKPKHHFLVHYPTAIRKCGPPKLSWVMRFEAKHRNSKSYLSSITSRIAECRSLAIKESLSFSYFLMKNKDGIPPHFKVISFVNDDIHKEYLKQISSYKLSSENVQISEHILYKGITYKKDYCLGIRNTNFLLFKILFCVCGSTNSLRCL